MNFGFESEYVMPIDNLIDFNRSEIGANNGLFSDAIANLGSIRLLILPLILVLSFKKFDSCVEGLDLKIYIVSG